MSDDNKCYTMKLNIILWFSQIKVLKMRWNEAYFLKMECNIYKTYGRMQLDRNHCILLGRCHLFALSFLPFFLTADLILPMNNENINWLLFIIYISSIFVSFTLVKKQMIWLKITRRYNQGSSVLTSNNYPKGVILSPYDENFKKFTIVSTYFTKVWQNYEYKD